MRKVRTLAVVSAAAASLALAPSAFANVYTVDGSGTRGGTPSKPKAATINAEFTVTADGGANLIPDVIKTYKISIEGGRLNKAALAKLTKCKRPADNQKQTADHCSKKAIVGKGTLSAAVGSPGDPIVTEMTCTLPYNLYNIGGYKLGLFISATAQQCPVAVKQWITVNVAQKGNVVTTTFTTPDNLQQPAPGLFSPVTKAQFSLKPVFVKIKKGRKTTKVSTTESIGCKGKKQRKVSVTFITAAGSSATMGKEVPC